MVVKLLSCYSCLFNVVEIFIFVLVFECLWLLWSSWLFQKQHWRFWLARFGDSTRAASASFYDNSIHIWTAGAELESKKLLECLRSPTSKIQLPFVYLCLCVATPLFRHKDSMLKKLRNGSLADIRQVGNWWWTSQGGPSQSLQAVMEEYEKQKQWLPQLLNHLKPCRLRDAIATGNGAQRHNDIMSKKQSKSRA